MAKSKASVGKAIVNATALSKAKSSKSSYAGNKATKPSPSKTASIKKAYEGNKSDGAKAVAKKAAKHKPMS